MALTATCPTDTPALSETTVTKCVTIHTFEPESQPSSPKKWVNCFSLASSTQEALNTKSDLESANLSHILLHIDIPNQHLYPLPMLITPVHCIYLVTFDLRYQKESLSKVHSVMKNVYTLTSYCSEAGGRKQLPEVLLVGMHAGEVVAENRSRFTQKLNEMLKKMPYNRLVEKPGGDEPFWAVDGGNLSLSGTDPLLEHIKICGCSHQVEVHRWIMHHSKLEEKLQNVPCISYNDLKSKLACISSDDHILKNCLQFLHNYGFIFDHSIKVEEEAEEGKEGQVANKGKEGQEREKVVLLQPQCLCDLFAKVPEFSKGKKLFTIADLFTRPAAYTKVGVTNKQWFQRICIDMGLVVALRSDYVFLMALEGGPPGSPPHDEYSVPPLLVTFKDSNHFIAEPEYLLPSYFFAAFATNFLGELAPKQPNENQPEVKVMEQHYMQVKKGTTVIHVVEQDSCLEIGLQQLDVCKKLTDEKKIINLHTFCRKIKSAVVESAKSTLRRMKLAPSSIRYGLYHSRETEDGPLDSFAAYIPDDQEGPYLECSCCDDGVQPTTPLQDIWFLEDFALAKVCACHGTMIGHMCCDCTKKHSVCTFELVPRIPVGNLRSLHNLESSQN